MAARLDESVLARQFRDVTEGLVKSKNSKALVDVLPTLPQSAASPYAVYTQVRDFTGKIHHFTQQR